ncbi:hypothetical protein MKW92_015973, partial [Papaver armeniacum]
NSKYLRLKEKLEIDVSNTKKNALAKRNEQVKANADAICVRYGHPFIKFNFPEVPPLKEEVYISNSDEESEEGEEFEETEEHPDKEREDEREEEKWGTPGGTRSGDRRRI